jgi:membrane-associated phospholipid phosphatase
MAKLQHGNLKEALARLMQQPAVQRIGQRYPRLSAFVFNRINPGNFVGLPLTLMLLTFAVNVALLSELTESVLESEWIVTLDMAFSNQLYNVRSDTLSYMFYISTLLGEREAVFIVGGVASVVFLYRKQYVVLLAFWLTMAGTGLTVRYGKTFISRERPADIAYYAVDHFSFPSGHATTAMALYGLLAYLLYKSYPTHAKRRLVLWLAAVLIVLVGFSRIYLGVHYLSDVLAGFLVGALWLLVGISLIEVMMYRSNKRQSKSDQIT